MDAMPSIAVTRSAALALSLGLSLAAGARAASVTLTDGNASLRFTIDEPVATLGVPNDPIQLPRTLEWTVDGRRILVYPSGPFTFVDVGHLHAGAHVAANQLHAQGPMLGFGTGATTGGVLGAAVYSVHGGAAGSGVSRITEKIDIHNRSGAPLATSLAGMGYKPLQAALEVPDLDGLEVTGTTTVYTQGTPTAASLTAPPFAPLTVRPVVSFTGFNPLVNQPLQLPDGAVLTLVTELKVGKRWEIRVVAGVLLAALLAVGGALAWRRRGAGGRA